MEMNRIHALVGILLFVSTSQGADVLKASFKKDVLPIFKEYCYKCHGDGERKGGLALDEYKSKEDVHRDYRLWEQLFKIVSVQSISNIVESKLNEK